MRRTTLFASAAFLFLPSLALASSSTDLISQLAGLFYVVVGLMLTMACLLMFLGTVLWVARFGTDKTYRGEAIRIMEWGVATLFTLVLVLAVAEFVQSHTSVVLYLISLVVIGLVIWLVATSIGSGEEKKKEE